MEKRIALLLIIFTSTFITISAQQVDQVTLKNGSVIRGSIVEIVPDGKVTIDDSAGNTWVFEMNEVALISQVEPQKNQNTNNFPQGWVNMTSIGFLAGSQNSMQVAPFSLISSFGYKNSLGMYTGFATGIEFLNINHVPAMLDIQYFLRNMEVSPVVIMRAGYAIPTKREYSNYGNIYSYSGGFAGALGIGLKIRSKENFAWDVSVLYRYMQISYSETYEWNQQENNYTDEYNRIELRLGFYLN